ncbi:hypothetical protein G195_003893 [Phytophthora kernoviae 00238/432]|uniref:HTH araC/xylS-type domain-containing protein n=1 Tax=Phytophthora kernoviae 00238/432 TaxID=1284355 RepID=A0A8J4W9G3_9STRA|nr:hypothetical protein G195_003893 [Phytophthora kernoviae 00238/432]
MGLFRTQDVWAHMDRIVDSDVLIFVRKGFVHIIEADEEYYIGPGQVFFMKHGVRHYGHKKTQAGSEWNWITFTPAQATTPGSVEMKWLEVEDYQRTSVRLTKLLDHYISGSDYDDLKLKVGTLDLLLDLYREMNRKKSGNQKLVTDVKNRVFSKTAGLSIQRYIMEQKIKEAIRLFSESSMNISQISEKLGYSNPYYFTRVFKQVTGTNPTSFLKKGYYDYTSSGDFTGSGVKERGGG